MLKEYSYLIILYIILMKLRFVMRKMNKYELI